MTIKSVALAIAALALTAPGASAADLARKAPAAVDYVKVCDTYGEGFFYIPGSDTCLKIGGYVRVKAQGGSDDFGNYNSSRDHDSFSTMTRLALQFDARSNTDFGLLRAYSELRTELVSGTSASTYIDTAYIQWGGLTAGRAQSFFDFWTGYTIEEVYGEAGNSDVKTTLLAYTFGLGNGVTATLSLEDGTQGRRTNGFVASSGAYGGNKAPDIVGNINVTQAWGSAQIMAAAHLNNSELSSVGDKWGYAIGAGVQFNLPMLGADDKIAVQAAWTKGAVSYASLGASSPVPTTFDYNWSPMTLVEAWSIGGGYQHSFNAAWSGAIQAGYLNFHDPLNGGNDYKMLDLSASVTWTPVKNLAFDLGVEYRHITDGWDESNDVSTNGFKGLAIAGRITRTF